MSSNKTKLTIGALIKEAEEFCKSMSKIGHKNIVGVTDGKAIGTYIEHGFKGVIAGKYIATIGSSASGIDFPDQEVNTDMKTTFITQP